MSDLQMTLVVTYVDATRPPDTVVAGQREMGAFERDPAIGCSSAKAHELRPVTFLRWLAWAALKRRGLKQGFAAWDELVDEVVPPDDEPAEVDPTTPDQRTGR